MDFFRGGRRASNSLMAREHWRTHKAADQPTDGVFYELSEASEDLLHGHPLDKPMGLDFEDPFLHWIGDFLIGRSFSVRVSQSPNVVQSLPAVREVRCLERCSSSFT